MGKGAEKQNTHIKNLWLTSIGLAVVLVFMLNSPGHALWVGQSLINPFLEVQAIYESNIFLESGDEESDFIIVVSPGVHFEHPSAEDAPFRVLADYRAEMKFYTKQGDEEIDPDEELNTINHRLGGQALFTLASGISGGGGYALNIASTSPDAPGDSRDGYKDHQAFAHLAYKFVDRYEIQFRYDGVFRRYDDEENSGDDSTTHRFGVTGFYKIFPTLSVLAGGSYAMVDREQPEFSDSTEYTGFGGVRLEATERITGILKAGATTKDFDDEALDDTTDVFISGELAATYDFTRMAVRVYRNFGETSAVSGSAVNGPYYVLTGVQAEVGYTLPAIPNLRLSGLLLYEQEGYPEDPDDRSDNILGFGVGADYHFPKYLTFGAHYEHARTDSSLDENDYSNSRAIVSVRAIL